MGVLVKGAVTGGLAGCSLTAGVGSTAFGAEDAAEGAEAKLLACVSILASFAAFAVSGPEKLAAVTTKAMRPSSPNATGANSVIR